MSEQRDSQQEFEYLCQAEHHQAGRRGRKGEGCVCVCVFVCVRERERVSEREQERKSII